MIFCNQRACSIITVTSGKHCITHTIQQNEYTFLIRFYFFICIIFFRSNEQAALHKKISWHSYWFIFALNLRDMNEELALLVNIVLSEPTRFHQTLWSAYNTTALLKLSSRKLPDFNTASKWLQWFTLLWDLMFTSLLLSFFRRLVTEMILFCEFNAFSRLTDACSRWGSASGVLWAGWPSTPSRAVRTACKPKPPCTLWGSRFSRLMWASTRSWGPGWRSWRAAARSLRSSSTASTSEATTTSRRWSGKSCWSAVVFISTCSL